MYSYTNPFIERKRILVMVTINYLILGEYMEMVSKRERQVYQWSQENVCPLPVWNSASEFDHLPHFHQWDCKSENATVGTKYLLGSSLIF